MGPCVNADLEDQVPEGFYNPNVRGFVGHNSVIWRRDEPDGAIVNGIRIAERNCNPGRFCHGGWLATFADIAMVREAARSGRAPITINMAIDYLEAVPLGAWVESRTETVRQSGRVVHVQGLAMMDGRPVLRMNGTFRVQPHNREEE